MTTNTTPAMKKGAAISDCGRYRYNLFRIWDDDPFKTKVAFIMLNPSTADADIDDATIRRCIGFAKDWGYNGLLVVNLFAYRATNPDELLKVSDPVGKYNDLQLHSLKMAGNEYDVVYAWGCFPKHKKRMEAVKKLVPNGVAIKLSKDGYPMHPLYLPKNLNPFNYGK